MKYDDAITSKKFEKRKEAFSKNSLVDSIEEVSESLWKEELQYIVVKIPDLGEVKGFLKGAITNGML